MSEIPFSTEAEWSVVGQMLSKPERIAEIVGQQIELDDFFRPDCRLIFEEAVKAYYSDERVDPVTIGERLRLPLSQQWNCQPDEVAQRIYAQSSARAHHDSAVPHAKLVKTMGDKRRIISLLDHTRGLIQANEMTPSEISDMLGSEVTKIATGGKKRGEILNMLDVGREFVKHQKRLQLARKLGIEMAVYTGLKFVDDWTLGVQPTELCLIGGEPGVGKSMLTWGMVQGFATRQMLKPPDKRVGAFVLSLEMGLIGSSARLATSMTKVDSDRLRVGDITQDELAKVIKAWKGNADLPLYWNFASNFRMSQMRALIVEAIRRHNVGLIVIDHFRMFDPDRRINNPNQEDEAKTRFLKEDIAKDLNVAVICLAHTVKIRREGSDGRPHLSDLRGSYQVAAHCDQVAFMYSPWMYATENEIAEGVIRKTDAELIFRKNRSGALGGSHFHVDAPHMTVRDL